MFLFKKAVLQFFFRLIYLILEKILDFLWYCKASLNIRILALCKSFIIYYIIALMNHTMFLKFII